MTTRIILAGLVVAVACVGRAAPPPDAAPPAFVVSGFDLGAADQGRPKDADLAAELTAQGWCAAAPKAAAGWSDVPAGVDPDRWVSVVSVGFGRRAEAYAFQFTGPHRAAKLLAHVPHRKRPIRGVEQWTSPAVALLDGFRVGHAAGRAAPPLPALQLEVVPAPRAEAKGGGAGEALTLAPEKVLPPLKAIVTAAACAAGWAPTSQPADSRARVEVRVLDQACGFRVTFTRGGKESVYTRDRVPWEEYHDQLALLLSIPATRPAVVDFARPSAESVELLGADADRIVCLVDDELTALDANTGAEAWRLRTPQGAGAAAARTATRYTTRRDGAGKLHLLRWAPALAEVAVADGKITPLAPTPAAAAWAFDAGANGEVAVVNGPRVVLVARGKEVWAATEPEAIASGPRLEPDRVMVGTGRGELAAFARADGRPLWRVPVGEKLWGPVTAVGAVRLVFSAGDETLVAVDPAGGSVKWRFAAGDALARPPFEFDGTVVVVTKQNRIVRLDPATGRPTAETTWPTWIVAVEPLVIGGKMRLAVGDMSGRLTILGPDLKRVWETLLGARVTGRPVVAATPVQWKGKPRPAAGGPENLLDDITADAAGTRPFLFATDAAGFLLKLSPEGIK